MKKGILNILVPTDFSSNADNAFKYAISFANKFSSEVYLLHVNESPNVDIGVPAYEVIEEVERESLKTNKKLETAYEYVREAQPDLNFSYYVENGDPAERILQTIKDKDIDLVIMGSRGGSVLNTLLFGNVAVKVLEKASCPVLLIPEKAVFKNIKDIVYASSFLDEDIDKIYQLTAVAKAFEAMLTVLNVSDEESRKVWLEKFVEDVQDKAPYSKLKFTSVKGADVAGTIEKYVKENKVDMLVMNTHKRIPFEKLYNRSLTEKLSYHIQLPLLVFHSNDE